VWGRGVFCTRSKGGEGRTWEGGGEGVSGNRARGSEGGAGDRVRGVGGD